MSFQHDFVRLYQEVLEVNRGSDVSHKVISVCAESFRQYKEGSIDYLTVKVGDEWGDVHPPLPRSELESFRYWSHTFSPTYMKKYYGK